MKQLGILLALISFTILNLFLTKHFMVIVPSEVLAKLSTYSYLVISVLACLLFFILLSNHLRIRGKVFGKSNGLALIFISLLMCIDLITSLSLNSMHSNSQCAQYIVLQFLILIPLYIGIKYFKNVSHKQYLKQMVQYLVLFSSMLSLKLSCASHDLHHVLISHSLPFLLWFAIAYQAKRIFFLKR
ncbi:hypothetical protein M901_2698 [Bacteriovorax sp. DB6_IX]|nr:hypothetical protein M901_2698 [Bacteriovorax sp. DB6_IX]